MIRESKERQRNLEELRCLAMLMVVVLHFLGKGELLGDVTASEMGAVGIAAWIFEALCIVAVNVYMFISGYFLSKSSFKLSRLLKLYLQIWTYSVGVGLLAAFMGLEPAEHNMHYFLSLLFPVSMGHYWFMTAYIFMYIMLPLVGMMVKCMTKGQLKLVLIMLLSVFCLLKSVLPFRLEQDGQGYDFIWYLCVFVTAAYIRKFGIKFLSSACRCMMLYIGGCAAVLAELFALRFIYLHSGKLGLILKISMEYNHVFVLLAAMGLFGWFLNRKADGAVGQMASKAAPYVLGVYLLHENIGIRYWWPGLFGADSINTVPQLILGILAAAICVFVTGVIIECFRVWLMGVIAKMLNHFKFWRSMTEGIKRADSLFVDDKS